MNEEQKLQDIPSPCVSICALDDDDICVGCHRSGEEITHWGTMNLTQKSEVMEKVRQREAGSYI